MAYLDWLPDVLRDVGVPIDVMPGAETRSTWDSGLDVFGVVWHDTVTPGWSDDDVLDLLRDGHANLSGPLSQVGLDRAGVWHLVALGRCNHNGFGMWGNDSIGIEMFNGGGDVGEINPPAQVESGLIGTAAILRHLELGPDRVKGHKETDPRRKIDPHALDMDDIRRRLAATALDVSTEEDHMDWSHMLAAMLRHRTGRTDLTRKEWGVVAWWSDVIAKKPPAERYGAYVWVLYNEPALKGAAA